MMCPGVRTRFMLNLWCGNSNITFHFNLCFDEDHPFVMCNIEQGGRRWEKEEEAYTMPFQPGTYVVMAASIWNTNLLDQNHPTMPFTDCTSVLQQTQPGWADPASTWP
ncbi:hypothetical protein Y1Q_0010119 [Alligator mississippiensis]|uniref:Galectin domain-containing protein n=1 Tax=Alligator mississippiensis TaxID=8496 RepID=A0A151MGA6_ALLMI|nr:hypothetical protein Y1Q_0010119 [Alligator mississippiensis]